MATRADGNPPILGSVASATNPSSGDVMADSGAVANRGNYEVRIILSASAAARFAVARRNAANDADSSPFPVNLYAAGGQSSQYALMVNLEVGERVRVTMATTLAGVAQAFIQLEAMA